MSAAALKKDTLLEETEQWEKDLEDLLDADDAAFETAAMELQQVQDEISTMRLHDSSEVTSVSSWEQVDADHTPSTEDVVAKERHKMQAAHLTQLSDMARMHAHERANWILEREHHTQQQQDAQSSIKQLQSELHEAKALHKESSQAAQLAKQMLLQLRQQLA